MRTAQEMYNYSVKNGFGKGMMGWGLKSFGVIEKNLTADEEAVICFIGLHNYISTSKHDGNYAYAITNKRLILGQKKVVGEAVQFINLDNLNDITKNSRMLTGLITFDTFKECFNVYFSVDEANRLYPVLNDYFSEFKKRNAPVATAQVNSVADEIRKYKQLLDDNIITQEEYDAKRKQLLGL